MNPSFQDEGVNTYLSCSNNTLCLSTWCLFSLTRELGSPALRLVSQPAHIYWVPLLVPGAAENTSELLKPPIPLLPFEPPICIPVCRVLCQAWGLHDADLERHLIRLLWLLNNKLLRLPLFSFPSTPCLLTVLLHTQLMSSIH